MFKGNSSKFKPQTSKVKEFKVQTSKVKVSLCHSIFFLYGFIVSFEIYV
jgi:hypothetical protein